MKGLVLSVVALLLVSTASAFAGGWHYHSPQMPAWNAAAIGGPAQANSYVGVQFGGWSHNVGFGQINNSSWAHGGNAFVGQGGFSAGYIW